MSIHIIAVRDKVRSLSSILSPFCNEFNNFNNTGAVLLDSIYYIEFVEELSML